MIQSIGSLKGAVVTLGKHNSASALQREALVQVTKVLQRKLRSEPTKVLGAVAPHSRHMLRELLGRPDGLAFLQQAPSAGSYAPQSGEIFGMLKQMKETFETNLENSKTEEANSAKAFAELKTAKESELKAGADKLFNKKSELGTTKEANARAKENLENTEDALEADTAFLADMKKRCATMDADWAARSKMRGEEIQAVSETIAILDSEDAHDQFTKSLGFVQLRAEAMRNAASRLKTVKFLEDAGKRLKSARVSYLAMRMRFDPFGKMRESIDGMVVSLGKEKEDEIVHKDDCVTDLNTNEKDSNLKHEVKTDLETEISSLETDISELTDEEKRMIQEIADAQLQMKIASENREKENKEYQETIEDQRATQTILQKAVTRLGEFYNKKALVQVPGEASSPMPAGFGEYKKAGGGGALAMINDIIADSKKTEQDAIVGELNSQAAYEAFIKDTNKDIKAKQEAIAADEEDVAEDKVQETRDEGDKRHTVAEILKLGDMAKAIHGECDFTLDNFDERQHSRDSEIEALKQSKAIFSGAGFGR